MKKVLAGLCLMLCIPIWAQVHRKDSVIRLPETTITAWRVEWFSTSTKVSRTDSLLKSMVANSSMADLLAMSTPVFIKNYGAGQLATTSIRGAASHHTAILWNGLNLQSSMHGQTDFSLLPVDFSDQIEVHLGGNNALFGGGAIGGAVSLINHSAYQSKQVKYRTGIGSFGTWQQWAGFSYGSKKYYSKVNAFYATAKNAFPYYDYSFTNNPLRKRSHAETTQAGVLLESGFRPKGNQEVNVRYWLAWSDRNIPATIGAGTSQAYQKDQSNRVMLDWKIGKSTYAFLHRLAYFNEYLNFNDPTVFESGISRSQHLIAETEYTRPYKFGLIQVGYNLTYAHVNSDGYRGPASRLTLAGFTGAKWTKWKNKVIAANLRKEWVSTFSQPLSSTLTYTWNLPRKWVTVTQISRSFRLPTLNDLYWVTGNPNLKPESSWGEELNVSRKFEIKKIQLTPQVAVFNRVVDHWIIWLPLGGSWTPQNVKRVWSRGAEFSLRTQYTIGQWVLLLNSDWSYVLSTNRKVADGAAASLNKQLIYTPRLTHQHVLLVRYKNSGLGVNYTYTGYRFITSDNTQFLPHYGVLNAFASWTLKHKIIQGYIRLQVNNLLGESYQVLPARPMPLTHTQLTLGITL